MPTQRTATTSIELPDSTLLIDLAPSRFLKVQDLKIRWQVTSLIVTIRKINKWSVMPSSQDIDPQTRQPREEWVNVMHVTLPNGEEWQPPMILKANANVDALIKATGGRTLKDVLGKRVKIIVGTYKGKEVLRIDPQPVADISPRSVIARNGDASSTRRSAAAPIARNGDAGPVIPMGITPVTLKPKASPVPVPTDGDMTIAEVRRRIKEKPGNASTFYWKYITVWAGLDQGKGTAYLKNFTTDRGYDFPAAIEALIKEYCLDAQPVAIQE